jgi:hypothetical protein
LRFGVGLMFAEKFGMETDVAGFIDTMNVSESSGDGEIGTNFREIAIYVPNIFWLSIQRSVINSSIVDA